jgi:predicted transcriptional regulator
MATKPVTIRLSQEGRDRLVSLCSTLNLSQAAVIEQALILLENAPSKEDQLQILTARVNTLETSYQRRLG